MHLGVSCSCPWSRSTSEIFPGCPAQGISSWCPGTELRAIPVPVARHLSSHSWPQQTASHMRFLTASCQLEWLSPGLSPIKSTALPPRIKPHQHFSQQIKWRTCMSHESLRSTEQVVHRSRLLLLWQPQPVTAGTESAASMSHTYASLPGLMVPE